MAASRETEKEQEDMATVFLKAVSLGPLPPGEPPYGAKGKRLHKGPKRSIVDFGKYGRWRMPNGWLTDAPPDPIFGEAAKIAGQAMAAVNREYS